MELAALWKAASKLAASWMWRTGQYVDVPVLQVMEEPTKKEFDDMPVRGDGTAGSDDEVEEAVGEVVVELAEPSGEARSIGPRVCDMTSAAATAAAKPVVEARHAGIAENSAPTESVCAVSPGEPGFSWFSAGTTSTAEKSQSLLLKRGLLGMQSSVSRQLPQLSSQQWQRLLMKLGLLRWRSSVPR